MAKTTLLSSKRGKHGVGKEVYSAPSQHKIIPDSVSQLASIDEELRTASTTPLSAGGVAGGRGGRKPATPGTYDEKEVPLLISFFTFLSFGILIGVGYIKEFLWTVFRVKKNLEQNRDGYVPLLVGFESFYFRHAFSPIRDCFDNPICSSPGEHVTIMQRTSTDNNLTLKLTEEKKRVINIGSYNYLGFAQTEGPCFDAAKRTIEELGCGVGSSRTEIGHMAIHEELETLTAEFLGTEAAISFGMGYATNVLNIPSLVGPGCLVLSDTSNHASIIVGLRLSGATVKVFKHNNPSDLEKKIKRAIIEGHPRTRRPWKKILIVVEGIYSMEGTICELPRIVEIKKKYKAYLYIDEAHSVGALGSRGGGVVDYHGCDPRDVDILMGTYTKSFAAAGGYIAGSRELIDHLRVHSDAQRYACSMAPPVAQQIITAMNIIMGRDGTDLGKHLRSTLTRNTRYLRDRLKQLGMLVTGHEDSPVSPAVTFSPGSIGMVFRALMERGIASVVVGFPATKLNGSRIRFCVSASHSKESLDKILEAMDEIGDKYLCKFGVASSAPPVQW